MQVNQGGQTRTFKYDAAGRLMFEKIPEQTATINDGTGTLWTTKYTYTDFGAVATKTDARGVITSYGYDTLNRLTSLSYNVGATGIPATPTVSYNFDNVQSSPTKGNLLSVTVGSVYTESYTYNIASGGSGGTDISETVMSYSIEGRTYLANFQHNQAGHHTRFGHVYYEYDALGRLSAVKNSSGVAWLNNLAYDINGRVSSSALNTSGGAVNETFGYDANRLQLTSHTASKGATSLMNLTYNYNATAGQQGAGSTAGNNGQMMSVSGTINATTESANYTYDVLGRLVTSNQTSNGASAQRRFSYDRWGNRTTMWDAVTGGTQIQSMALAQSGGAPTNRLTSVTNGSTTLNYLYDANGNVTNDGLHSFQYDAENRVVSVDNGATASYSYNHRNQRVKKTAGGATTHYVCHNTGVLAEYNGATGAVLAEYVTLGSQQIAKIEAGVTSYFLNDSLSARVVLNSSGAVIGRQSHLPFGEELGVSGAADKHRFTSYEREGEAGNDEAWNRRYGSGVGRFLSSDPYQASGGAENPQSWNRYSYVLNNPVNFVDPSGLLLAAPPIPGEGPPPSCVYSPGGVGDIIETVFGGTLYVSPLGCGTHSVGYVKGKKINGKAPWFIAPIGRTLSADFVVTARGLAKIPNGCSCTVQCDGVADYQLNFACSLINVGRWAPRQIPPTHWQDGGGEVVDPRKEPTNWAWAFGRYGSHPYREERSGFDPATWLYTFY